MHATATLQVRKIYKFPIELHNNICMKARENIFRVTKSCLLHFNTY